MPWPRDHGSTAYAPPSARRRADSWPSCCEPISAVLAGMVAGLIAARGAAAAIGALRCEVMPGDPAPYLPPTLLLAALGASACHMLAGAGRTEIRCPC